MDNNLVAVFVVVLLVVIYLTNISTKNTGTAEIPSKSESLKNHEHHEHHDKKHVKKSTVDPYIPHPPYFLIDPDCPYDIDDSLYYLCAYDPYIPYRSVVYPDNHYWGGYGKQHSNWTGHVGHMGHMGHMVHPPRPHSSPPIHSPRPSHSRSPRHH